MEVPTSQTKYEEYVKAPTSICGDVQPIKNVEDVKVNCTLLKVWLYQSYFL